METGNSLAIGTMSRVELLGRAGDRSMFLVRSSTFGGICSLFVVKENRLKALVCICTESIQEDYVLMSTRTNTTR